jgi:hypothetical protein
MGCVASRLHSCLFVAGDKPQMETQGSMYLRKDAVNDKHAWSAKLIDVQGDTLSFEVSRTILPF